MTTKERLGRIESKVSFRMLFHKQRMFEAMSIEELETLAITDRWPDRPEPAPGTSRLDTMDRVSLLNLWKEDQRLFAGRNSEELEFYATHGHWPERRVLTARSEELFMMCLIRERTPGENRRGIGSLSMEGYG